MKAENIKVVENSGCDFIISLPSEKKNRDIKLLQITDMQFIDANQRRTPDRIRADEIAAWDYKNADALCKNHIRSLVAQSLPDLIFITGDIVYGSFDDSGAVFDDFCRFMDSLEIPWAPVFGNHDNESKVGVKWQCEQFEKSKYCVFKRGEVSGNGNYTIGISVGGEIVRVLHMIDSNGCYAAEDPEVINTQGIFPDQMAMVEKNAEMIEKYCGRKVPAFAAFHIPVKEFEDAEINCGYKTDDRNFYTIGVDVEAKNGDFGFKLEKYTPIETEFDFVAKMKKVGVDGVFAGHCHNICTVIDYEQIKWVFGLKTGQYDYHIPGQTGGTLISLRGDDFVVNHLSSLVPLAPYPYGASMFDDFFVKTDEM